MILLLDILGSWCCSTKLEYPLKIFSQLYFSSLVVFLSREMCLGFCESLKAQQSHHSWEKDPESFPEGSSVGDGDKVKGFKHLKVSSGQQNQCAECADTTTGRLQTMSRHRYAYLPAGNVNYPTIGPRIQAQSDLTQDDSTAKVHLLRTRGSSDWILAS